MAYFFLLFVFMFGASIGSFINVLVDRLPEEKSINGRSHCDFCKKQLRWYDLIPVLSFIVLGGKCRYCHKRLSKQYPIVEVLTGLIFIFIVIYQFHIVDPNLSFDTMHIQSILLLITVFGIFSCLFAIFVTDLKYQIIPDELQIAFLLCSIFYLIITGRINSIQDIGYYGISGAIVLFPIWFIHALTKGKGMGFGDVKLSYTIGILLGIAKGLISLYIGFVAGGIVSVFLIVLRRKKLKSKIAFGPFLILGITIMFFWGERIVEYIKIVYGL